MTEDERKKLAFVTKMAAKMAWVCRNISHEEAEMLEDIADELGYYDLIDADIDGEK